MASEVLRLRSEGIPVGPSDAQQMLLEMVPEARWEVTRVVEEVATVRLRPNTVTIETRVTCVRLTDDATDIAVDVLNEERVVEMLQR